MVYTSLDSLLPSKLVRMSNHVLLYPLLLTNDVDENNVYPLFDSLDRIEKILSESDYLVKNTFTEADIRLFTTIVRYVVIAKCLNARRKAHASSITDSIPCTMVISSATKSRSKRITLTSFVGPVVFTKCPVVSVPDILFFLLLIL